MAVYKAVSIKNKKLKLLKADKEAIYEILDKAYPVATTELDFTTPFQLLVATILSAQCTDKLVNKVTPALFEAAPDAEAMDKLTKEEIAGYIKKCGLYPAKSKYIKESSHILATKYGGEVPPDRKTLETLPGVGRKTANVVLANAFDIPTFAVDTHVFRVSQRIGFASGKNTMQVEEQLEKNIPKKLWVKAHHWLILHGRRICKARKPLCAECPISQYCLYYRDIIGS